MPKYTCEHKVCTVVSTGGLRFECRTKAKLQEHSRFRSYHPCCKDQSNLCPTGKKVKEWREGTSIVCKVASPVYYLCPHVSCDKRYHKKNNYDNHMKTMHQCMEDCEACGKKVEDENRMEEENNYADKRRKEHLAAHDLEREVWKEHQKQKQEMELRGEHSSSIDALIEDLDKGEYDLCLPEVLDIPDIPLSLNQDDYIPIPNEKYFDIPINGTVVRMETVPNNEKPKACIAGCGFLGTLEHDGFCQQCNSIYYNHKKIPLRESENKPKSDFHTRKRKLPAEACPVPLKVQKIDFNSLKETMSPKSK